MMGSLFPLLAAFGAGLLASLSPCVYPLIPITVGFLGTNSATGGKTSRSRLLLFSAGQTLCFVLLGYAAVTLGETFGFSSESRGIRIALGALLIVFGLVSLLGKLPSFALKWNNVSAGLGVKLPGGATAFALGIGSALVASPCSSPVLAGVLTMMASSATLLQGALLMTVYGLGFSLVFVLIGLGLARLKSLPRAGAWMVGFHRLSSAVLLVAGTYFLFT